MLSYSLFFFVHSYHILAQPFLTLDTIARWYQSGVRSWKLKNQYQIKWRQLSTVGNTHEESYRWQSKEESSDRYTSSTRRDITSI